MAAVVALLAATLWAGSGTAGAAQATTLTPNQAYVTALSVDFLGRPPTPTELANESAALDAGEARATLVDQLATSPTWIDNIVNNFYTNTLGRPGDAGGVAYWEQKLASHSMTVAQVAANFYASDEYFNGIGGGTTTSWITDLYSKLLHRTPDTGGLGYFTEMTVAKGRVVVAFTMFQSNESCQDRVTDLYHELLHRGTDPSGLQYWAAQVAKSGDLVLARNLAISAEYYNDAQARFANPTQPLSIGGSMSGGTVGVVYSATFTSSGGVAPVSFSASGLPPGLSISSGGVVSGTPTSAGTFTPTVTVTDHVGTHASTSPTVVIASATVSPWTVLPTPNGYTDGTASAINDAGLIVGAASDTNSIEHAMVWTSGTHAVSQLGVPSGYGASQANAVSSDGTIVGEATDTSGNQMPIVWDRSTHAPTILPIISGYSGAVASGVNSSGIIIGSTFDSSGNQMGTVWGALGGNRAMMLASPFGQSTTAAAINDAGEIAGSVDDAGLTQHAALWASAIDQNPTVLDSPTGAQGAQATAIDASGRVAGTASTATQNLAVTWNDDSAHSPSILALTSGASYATPSAINTNGTIVGTMSPGTFNTQPLLWTGTGHVPTNPGLPDGDTQATINGMNDGTAFVGSFFDTDGLRHGVVYTTNPVPLYVTGSVPTRVTGIAITASFTAGGGTAPYNFAAMGLPAGLAMSTSGTVTGSATKPGSYQATVTVTDHLGHTATVQVAIVVSGGVWTTLLVPPSYAMPTVGGIGDNGAIVGYAQYQQTYQALYWATPGSAPEILPIPGPYENAQAIGVASDGTIAGVLPDSIETGLSGQPVIWQGANHTPSFLTLPGNSTAANIGAMGSNGEIVGSAFATYNTTDVAVAWDAATHTPVTLDLPTGSTQGHANGVNATGLIVGSDYDASFNSQAIEWSSSSQTGTVLPLPSGATQATALGVNASGIVVGSATLSDGSTEAVEWDATAAHTPTVLSVPTPFTSPVSATAVDDAGTIVGLAQATIGPVPVEWDASAAHNFLAVPTAPGVIAVSTTMNASGVIAGTMDGSGSQSAQVYTSSPFPLAIDMGLANGTVGDPYNGSVGGFGGVAPLTFHATGLPPGMTMATDGTLSGTPTAAGTFQVVVTLTDSYGTTVSMNANLVIDPNPWTQIANGGPVVFGQLDGVNRDGTLVVGDGTSNGANVGVEIVVSTGNIVALPLPPGTENGHASSVNDNGLVVGSVYDPSTQRTEAVEWDATAAHAVTVLPVSASGTTISNTVASAINDAGLVVGQGVTAADSANNSSFTHVVEWDATSSHDATLFADPTGHADSVATDINASGVVVGETDANSYASAVVWTADSSHVATVLTDPPGVSDAVNVRVNDDAVVSATVQEGDAGCSGVVWDAATRTPTALENVAAPYPYGSVDAGEQCSEATALSGSGEVVGQAYQSIGSGEMDAVTWAAGTYAPSVLPSPAGLDGVNVFGVDTNGSLFAWAADQSGNHVLVIANR